MSRGPIDISIDEWAIGQKTLLADIKLQLSDDFPIAIVGKSGIGKSQLLRAIYHSFHTSQKIGFVFQEHCLLPWLTVQENISLVSDDQSFRDELLERFDLQDYANFYPNELSGGMNQKVSLARALISKPDLLLLDEPFSALDYLQRHSISRYVKEQLSLNQQASLLVTHDIQEAIELCRRVYILKGSPASIAKSYEIEENLTQLERLDLKESVLRDIEYE